jgi:Leucine-rich repeat (LRR) protein
MSIGYNIEKYLNSLHQDTEEIYIVMRNITHLPNLTRFKKLKSLNCRSNEITRLPRLPDTLEELNCENNNLTCLPVLPKNLKYINCSNNKITHLPKLPYNLMSLDCSRNKLTSLPELPNNLETIYCYINRLYCLPKLPNKLKSLFCNSNHLSSLPILPKTLKFLNCGENEIEYLPPLPEELGYFNVTNIPLFDMLYHNYNVFGNHDETMKKRIELLNNCRNMIYAIKFKNQFREWLWVKVREPKIKEKYHHKHLLELKEEDDLDLFLEKWIVNE